MVTTERNIPKTAKALSIRIDEIFGVEAQKRELLGLAKTAIRGQDPSVRGEAVDRLAEMLLRSEVTEVVRATLEFVAERSPHADSRLRAIGLTYDALENATLAEQLRIFRNRRGYTHEQVANYAGIAPNTYGKYELAKTKPATQILERIANFYELTTDERAHILETRQKMGGRNLNGMPHDSAPKTLFGAEMRRLRLARELTQTELGNRLGWGKHGYVRVSELELGKIKPSEKVMLELTTAMSLTPTQQGVLTQNALTDAAKVTSRKAVA